MKRKKLGKAVIGKELFYQMALFIDLSDGTHSPTHDPAGAGNTCSMAYRVGSQMQYFHPSYRKQLPNKVN
jgi:hypothetical protein